MGSDKMGSLDGVRRAWIDADIAAIDALLSARREIDFHMLSNSHLVRMAAQYGANTGITEDDIRRVLTMPVGEALRSDD